MKTIAGVLLDIDGTLLDSTDAHASTWADALAEFGTHRPVAELRKLVGMGSDQLFAHLGLTDEVTNKKIGARKKELFYDRFLPTLQPFPGARALITEFRRRGLVRVVATSAGKDEVHDLLKAAQIADLIEDATSKNDAPRSKPAPDIVEVAVERSGLPAEQLIMLGDTPYDIISARAANVAVIALRCSGWSDAELHGAHEIYDSPNDLLNRLDTSLLGRSQKH